MLHILAEVAPLKIADGSRPVLRASSAQDRRLNGVAGERWWPGITKLPSLAIPLFDGDFTEEVAPGSASFTLRLEALANLDASVRAYRWAGAAVSLYAIDGGLSLNAAGSYDVASLDAARIFKGRVESFAIDGGALSLTAEVDQEPFNKDVLQLTYAGTGEAEGGEDLKERLKPWIFGRALNVEPILINSVDNVVQFSAYPIQGISALYERGSSFGPSIGNYSSYAQLVAATLPAGRWATCHALGMARLGAPPYGIITGDVDGDNVSGFIRRTGAIIRRVALASGVALDQIDTASLDALDAAVPYDINLVLTEQISVLDLARRLALPCNAQAGLDFQGRLFAVRPSIGSPSLTLDAQGRQLPPVRRCQEADVSAPYKRIMFGANRSWRVHTFDEIAFDAELVDRGDYDPDKTYRRGNIVSLPNGSRWLYVSDTPKKGSLPSSTNADWEQMTGAITAGNITYEDGTPVEDLKPAEPGATDGASPAEKDQLAQLEADTAAAQVRMEQADAKIADLFETYGDSASAAQSALAAAQSAQTAQDAEANAEQARDLAEDARAAADAAVSDASAYADASSLSATASNTAKTAAETAKTAAETARTQAQTARTDAQTAFNNSATARDASVAAKTASELARDNAQTYASNANGSATAAAGSASTASTKATEAGNSATAAAASQVSAASSYADAQALAYVSAPLLISGFAEGAKHWTAARAGNPTSIASIGGGTSVVDADLGAALEIGNWTAAGANILSKGVIQIVPGRIYEVTAKFKITASDGSVGMNVILGTMAANYAQASVSYVGSPSVDCNGTGLFTLTRKFTVGGGTAITSIPADVLTARPGLRLTTAETGMLLRISEIRVNDVTEREAASTHADAAATSASSASTSAGAAGESATAAQESATNASTSAGNANTYAQNASNSENNAAGSASAALNSQGAAADSATTAGQKATAASESAQTASTKATEAGQKATAAQQSATNAATAAGNANTYATQASESADDAEGSASSASSSAGAAAQSKNDAAGSANAAAGSAQTASTKATEAGQSASAASTSATNAASNYSSAVAVVLTSLPEKYTAASDPYFSLNHVGSPASLTPALANATASDGTPVYALVAGSGQNLNWAQRGVFPAIAGRIYEIEFEYQVLAVSGAATVSAYVRSLDASYASITSSGAQIASAVGTYTSKHLVANPASSDPGSLSWHSSAVWLRAFLNVVAPAGASISVQARRIRVSDVTAREAAKVSATAAATSASTASTKATEASQSADSATTSANTASTKAGEATTSATNAASSASDALGSKNSASTSANNAAQSKTDAANSATAASGSASTAATHATNAGNSATSASSSAVSAASSYDGARLTGAYMMPSDFQQDGLFWQNGFAGLPASVTSITANSVITFPTVSGVGKVLQAASATRTDVGNVGTIKLIAGRTYKLTARVRQTAGALGQTVSLFRIGVNADGTTTGNSSSGNYALAALNTWYDVPSITFTSDVYLNQGVSSFRALLRIVEGAASTTVQVAYIRIEDITESTAANASATAAAGSASTASTKATEAGNSADSATASANTASTKANNAADSADAAATSASAASTSSNAASQSASAASSNKVAAEIASTSAAYLDAGYVADFTSNLNGFAGNGATVTATATGMVVVPTTGDPYVYKNGLSIQGSRFTRVLIELTRSAPTLGGWDGSLYWATSGHGWSGSYRAFAVQGEPAFGTTTTLVFDMPNAAAGASDWMASTITGLRFDLDSTSGGGRQSVIRSIRVMGPDSAAPAKAVSAAATSASSAAGYADDASESAGAASESATSAATSASNAGTSETNASTSETNAEGSASSASNSAAAAATSEGNAGDSATAAASSASTASTKATEAGQSATSAAASAVSANSTYNAMVQSQAASPVLPSDFSDGMNQWVDDRYGNPQALPNSAGQVINGDGVFGRCADYTWSTGGMNVLTRGTMPLVAGRFYEVRARFRVRQGDGSYTFNIVAAWLDANYAGIDWVGAQTTTVGGGVVEIVALFGSTTTNGATAWPSSAVYGRFGLRLNGAESGMIVRIGTIRVIDVTEKLSASNSANAASTSATNAATSATNADTSASAASGHADTAQTKSEDAAASASSASNSAAAADDSASSASSSASQASTYKGDAESAASTATSQATVATNAAAAASSSATITAQVAAASINPNPVFSDWPNGQALPSNYTLWQTATVYKMTGAQSPYAPMTVMASTTSAQGGGLQSNPYVSSQVIQNGMWLVLEVDARRDTGDLRGACVLFRVLDSSNSTAQNHYVDLYADADTAGAVGNGNTGVRRWRKLVKVQTAAAYGWRIYMMNRFSGTSSYTTAATTNQIEWHRVSFRPATDQEIAAKQATADISDLSATVETQADTLSTLSTNYASLSTTVETQGVSISNQAEAISDVEGDVTTLLGRWGFEIDVNGYVSGMVMNNNGQRANLTFRTDRARFITPSGKGGYWNLDFDSQGRPTQTIGDDASGVTIELGYLA